MCRERRAGSKLPLRSASVRPALAACSLVLAVACSPLDPILENACGNGVIEPGEDCDRFAPEARLHCAQVGEPLACHFTCSPSGGAPGCPTGWACGSDGQCRRGSGRLVEAGLSPISVGGLPLGFFDFDGDGALDLLTKNFDRIEVRYGGRKDRLEDPVSADFPGSGLPTVGDLDGDGRADLVIPTTLGVVTVPGRADRAMLSVLAEEEVAYQGSSFEIGRVAVLAVRTARSSPGHEVLFLSSTNRGIEAHLLGEPSVLVLPGDHQLGATFERLPVADLDGDEVDEVVMGLVGESVINVFTTACTSRAEACATPLVAYPPAPTIPVATGLQGVRVGDVDGDRVPDLLLRSNVDIRAVHGLPGGGFGPPEVETLFSQVGSSFPTAMGDLDGDGVTDWVIGRCGWVTRSERGERTLVPVFCGDDHFTDAKVVDLNRDGWPDVAAVSFDQGYVFLNTGTARFNPTRYVVRSPDRIEVGDFDGDLVPDLAVTSIGGDLQILFGRGQGAPAAPVDVADVGTMVSLASGAFTGDDLISDLAVVTASSAFASRQTFSLLTGLGAEIMLSPLDLVRAGEPRRAPTRVFRGKFADGDDEDDLVIFSQPLTDGGAYPSQPSPEDGLWVIPGEGRARLRLDRARFVPARQFEDSTCWQAMLGDVKATVIHTDRLDRDVLVAAPRGSWFLPIITFSGEGESLTVNCRVIRLPDGISVTRVEALDLGDGGPDLLIAFQSYAPSPVAPQTGSAWLLRATPAGTPLDWSETPLVVPVPPAGQPLVTVSIQLDEDAPRELAIFTAETVWAADVEGDVVSIREAPISDLGLAFTSAVLTPTDVDRDGLEDLAFLAGDRLRVLLSVPASGAPGAAREEVTP